MLQLRAILVGMPPLLADLTRQVLIRRLDVSVAAEISASDASECTLLDLNPDVVIIGPLSGTEMPTAACVRKLLPNTRVLAVSADLLYFLGPDEGVVRELTPENLAVSLRR